MRIDHIAYRVPDKEATINFFAKAFGYSIADSFEISFDDGTCAQCYALSPPERLNQAEKFNEWSLENHNGEYHMPPEIFVSEGSPGSIVSAWVDKKGGIGGIHHIAYQVDDVSEAMSRWKKEGLADFTTDKPISSDGLEQCFTKESPITGITYEFISRTTKGFNVSNVKDLMKSTKDT